MTQIPECLKDIAPESLPERDCFYYKILDQYYQFQKKIHVAPPQTRVVFQKYLKKLEEQIIRLSQEVTCFPNHCYECPGMSNCTSCGQKESCFNLLESLQKEEIRKECAEPLDTE